MAIAGAVAGFLNAAYQPFVQSDRFARSGGACGCIFGLVISFVFVISETLRAVLVFFDRLSVGVTNGIFRKDYDYVLDLSWQAKVFKHRNVEAEVENFMHQGIPKARRRDLLKAFDFVGYARQVFQTAKPHAPSDHKHFDVVTLDKLKKALMEPSNLIMLKMTSREAQRVNEELDKLKLNPSARDRRSKMFPRLRKLKQKVTSSAELASDGVIKSTRSALSKDSASTRKGYPDDIESGGARSQKTLTVEEDAKVVVSFSMFVEALRKVCASKANIATEFRSSVIRAKSQARIESLNDYSEYLPSTGEDGIKSE